MKWSRRLGMLGTLIAAIALALPPRAGAQNPAPLSVIVFPGGFNWPIWAAQEQGYFAKQSVEVEKVPYAGLDAVVTAFRANEIDGGVGGIATIVKVHADGVPVQVAFGSVAPASSCGMAGK